MTQQTMHETEAPTIPELSDLRVDRVAGLSTEDLSLTLDETILVEAELTSREKESERLGELVSEVLFGLVPLLQEDPAARRRTLAVRRSTRPGKTPRPEDIAEVRRAAHEHLDAGDRELLDLWVHAVRARDTTRERFMVKYSSEAEDAQRVITAAAHQESFARGVAHASPSLGACLDSVDTTPYTQGSRGLSSYATRAAFKTSPFSELTTVTHNGRPDPRSEQLYVAPSVIHEWFRAMTQDPYLARSFSVEPLDTGRTDIRQEPALVAETLHTPQFTWVKDQRVDLSEYADVLDRLRWLGRQPVATYLEAIGGDKPFATLSRLCAVNVVRYVAPWGYANTDRLGALISALETQNSEKCLRITNELRDIRSTLHTLREASGVRRAEILRDLPTPSLPGVPPTAVFSDVMGGVRVPSSMPSAEAELTRVLAGTRPLIFRSFIYGQLCQHFKETFGTGGRCDDVAGYLSALAANPALQQATIKDMTASLGEVAQSRSAPVGRSSAAPSCAVMYQVCAGTTEKATNGEGELVLNQFNPGLGGLVARFEPGENGTSEVRDGLRAWIRRLYPEATPLEFITSSDVNDMQAVSEGTLPRLVWPTDTPRADNGPCAVALADLHLRHDSKTDTVELLDAEERPVAPVYLGLVPAHLLGGASRILAVLGDPWVNRATWLIKDLGAGPGNPADTKRASHQPRVQRGRVVFKRESWTVPVDQVPVLEPQEPHEDYFRRLQRFRESWGLPREVFVRPHGPELGMGGTASKPAWVSFASPHAWAPVSDRLKKARSVTFQEALPTADQYWLTDEQGHHRAVEHISFLTWSSEATLSEEATP